MRVRCIGCGGLFPDEGGPVHRYMESSPGCWKAYGVVLAQEYSDLRYWAFHRLTVDTYAVQHPGTPSPQTIQSVGIHLMRLCMMLEGGVKVQDANKAMVYITRYKPKLSWLSPPSSRGEMTVADFDTATEPEAHLQAVKKWAQSAWEAWALHHPQVRVWIKDCGLGL